MEAMIANQMKSTSSPCNYELFHIGFDCFPVSCEQPVRQANSWVHLVRLLQVLALVELRRLAAQVSSVPTHFAEIRHSLASSTDSIDWHRLVRKIMQLECSRASRADLILLIG